MAGSPDNRARSGVSEAFQIVGIVLVRDEDLFLEAALRNVLPACDKVLVADHQSRDGTPGILARLQAEFPAKLGVRRVAEPGESQDMIAGYAGTRTWIFGIDGDEIYDPARLESFFAALRAGRYEDRWMILGNVLNVTTLEAARASASGHLAPPCRSMTKLYNFSAITAWTGPCPERLHGGTVSFRPGYAADQRVFLHDEEPWEASPFRCLHLCFLRRSSREQTAAAPRANIMDLRDRGWRKLLAQAVNFLLRRESLSWKQEKYRRGPEVTLPIGDFRLP